MILSSPNCFSREDRLNKCCEALKGHLERLNQLKDWELLDHIAKAIDNYVSNAKYRFVDGHGPRLGKVTKETPLMHE